MRVFFILLIRELKGIFLSPTAYIVLACFTLVSGLILMMNLNILQMGPNRMSLVQLTFNSIWFWISYLLILPLLTMRLLSEEQKSGTIEPLLTAPVRTWQVVLSKYLAAFSLYAVLWAPSMLHFYIYSQFSGQSAALSTSSIASSYTLILLMGAFYIAVGIFASALSSQQIVAGFVAFSLILIHWLLGYLVPHFSTRLTAEMMETLAYFSSVMHMRTFSGGLIDTRAIVYYLSFAVVMLFLTHQALESRKWKS